MMRQREARLAQDRSPQANRPALCGPRERKPRKNAARSHHSFQARQAEPGPTVRNVLVISTSAVIVIFAIIWFVFFHT